MAFFKPFDLKRVKPAMAQKPTPIPETVTIPIAEYERLLRESAQLSRLQAASQPAAHETLGMLINSLGFAVSYATQSNIKITTEISQLDLDIDSDLCDWDRFDMQSLDSFLGETRADTTPESSDDFVARENIKHTVILLPSARVTHAQVAAAVRGGALIQIFLQRSSNQVNVTFARSEDAAGFLAHAQSAPFYVGGHLTIVQWAPRGYIAPRYVLEQAIEGTVSRNLLLKNVNSKVTEAIIRRDMHHIHNMAIISVTFANGNAYISTSSVGGALYARTCMRSRAFYKGMRISFAGDECALPFSRSRRPCAVAPVRAPKKPKSPIYNPYEVLSQGDFDLGDDEEDEEL